MVGIEGFAPNEVFGGDGPNNGKFEGYPPEIILSELKPRDLESMGPDEIRRHEEAVGLWQGFIEAFDLDLQGHPVVDLRKVQLEEIPELLGLQIDFPVDLETTDQLAEWIRERNDEA